MLPDAAPAGNQSFAGDCRAAEDGFRVVRQGKHTAMTDGQRILIIPRANPVNAFTMGGIARDAGLTPQQFRRLL